MVLGIVLATPVIVVPLGGLAVAAVFERGWVAFLAWDADSRNLYQSENARDPAQDRHGFAPSFGFAMGPYLLQITAPSPYCRRRATMDAARKNKFTPHSSCRRMATSSLRIQALTVPTGTRRYSAISSCVRPSMIARSRLARRFGSS